MRISTKFISCSVVLWAAIAYAAAGDDDYYGNPEPAPTPAPAPGHWPAFISYHSVFINVGQQDEVSAVYVEMHRCPVHRSSIYLRNMYDFLILVLQGYVS